MSERNFQKKKKNPKIKRMGQVLTVCPLLSYVFFLIYSSSKSSDQEGTKKKKIPQA